jgi:acyl carrier protein
MNTKKIVKTNSMAKKHYKGRLKILAFLPFYHVFGLIATYLWYSFFGRTFVFLKDYSTSTILKTVKKHKVTHVFAVPMLWHGIYREITRQVNSSDEKTQKKFKKGIELSIKLQNIFPSLGKIIAGKLFEQIQSKVFGDSIQFMISGGGYISDEANKLINAIGYPLYNGYGMSEIGITSVELRKKVKYRLEGTIGKPFDSVEYLVDDNVLMVKGKSLCKTIITENGSINIDNNEWFNTSDISKKNNNGTYMINGRKDDVVISTSGEKLNPDLIEKEIFIPECIRHCVLGLNYENKNALTLVVEISEGISLFNIKKLVEEVDDNLIKLQKLNYGIERVYFTYDPIAAKTAVKVSRKILMEWVNNGKVKLLNYNQIKARVNVSDEELVNEISAKIKNIMAEVLSMDVSKISVKSHYIFDLGGSSLDYISLLMKLKEDFGIEFSGENSLYNAEALANYIIEKNGGL